MNSVFKWWDRIFPLPTPQELAMQELQEAKRQLLLAQSAKEHAAAMAQYNEERVARLQAYVSEV